MTNDVEGPDPDEDDPFKCPVCGSKAVRCKGDGSRDCMECPWEYRPSRDPVERTKQVGIDNW